MNVFHFGIQIFPFDMNRSPSQLCDVWRIRVYLESKTIGEDNFWEESRMIKQQGGSSSRARPVIGFTDYLSQYWYWYRYIGSDIVNIGIGIIGIGIGFCYNYIIGYDIGSGIKSWFNRYNEISVSVSLFYRYIGISSIIGIGIGLVSNSVSVLVWYCQYRYQL